MLKGLKNRFTLTSNLYYQERPDSSNDTFQPGNQCRKEGFFRNIHDCTKFYRCYSKEGRLARKDFDCAPDHKNQPTAFDET